MRGNCHQSDNTYLKCATKYVLVIVGPHSLLRLVNNTLQTSSSHFSCVTSSHDLSLILRDEPKDGTAA